MRLDHVRFLTRYRTKQSSIPREPCIQFHVNLILSLFTDIQSEAVEISRLLHDICAAMTQQYSSFGSTSRMQASVLLKIYNLVRITLVLPNTIMSSNRMVVRHLVAFRNTAKTPTNTDEEQHLDNHRFCTSTSTNLLVGG
jgi:hypothetical protein